jgi:hypothetical protein
MSTTTPTTPGAPPRPLIVAVLNPGANATNILNFAVSEDVKFYHRAIKGLDDSMKYDLSPIGLRTFLDNVSQRCTLFGLDSILIVQTATAPNGENLIESYGKITMAECAIHARRYFIAMGRSAQNSTMLYHFLYASLTKDALTKINLRKATFTTLNNKDGVCFLRAIITEAQLDTIGTVETYRKQLSTLPTKIIELSGNIIDFHQYVNTITGALDAYGKEYPELILNLFESYQKVEDKEFSTYIMITRFGYVAAPNTYDPRTLMSGVENLYKMRIQAGTWQPALEKQQVSELAALAAKVDDIKTGRNGRNKQKIVKNEKNAWKFIVPKEGEAKTMEYETRTYHWCPKHKYWTMHLPSECKLKEESGDRSNADIVHANTTTVTTSNNRVANRGNPTVKVNDALRTYIENIDEDDDDDFE